MKSPRCPDCDEDLQLNPVSLQVDAIVICPECGVELKVTKRIPVTFVVADDAE